MNGWIPVTGAGAALGLLLVIDELLPPAARLDAALTRLTAAGPPQPDGPAPRRLARQLAVAAPWLPVPSADLRLLGQDTEAWVASKIMCGLLGLALPAVLTALLSLGGARIPWALPVVASIAAGLALFMAPDLVTRIRAAEKRAEFLHAVTSYLDLVALERGAGAGPTEALEAAARIGGGWAFDRIGAALAQARHEGIAPWEGLAKLGSQVGVPELTDLADIAGIAGEEGAKILDTLMSRAESMRSAALAATRAKASSRTTTMAVPIALLAAGFMLLLIFPTVYRTFGPG